MPEPNPNPNPADQTTLAQLAGLIGGLETKIVDQDKKLHVRLDDVDNKAKALDEYIKGVEKKVTDAQKTALPNGEINGVRNAIPDRMRKAIDLQIRFARVPEEKAIQLTAMEAWLKNSILVSSPQVAGRVGGQLVEEMDKLERAMGFDPKERATMTEGTPALSGTTIVPVPLEAEVMRQIQDAGIGRQLCRIMPMTAVSHGIPSLNANTAVAIVAEAGAIGQNEPTFNLLALTAKMIATRALCTLQLVQDNAIGLLSFISLLMNEQYALFEDKQLFEGDGTGTNFTGLVAAAGVTEVFAAGTAAGNGAAPSYAQLVAQKWAGRKRSTRRGAAFVAPPDILRKYEQLLDSQNRPIFTAPIAGSLTNLAQGGDPAAPDGFLQGYPAYSHDQLLTNRAVGTSGNVCANMYFGPFQTSCIIGDLLGLTFGVSEHTNWSNGLLDLRMLKRTGILVAVPANMTKQTGLITT